MVQNLKLTDDCEQQPNSIHYHDDKELAMILSVYGDLVTEIEKEGDTLTPEQIIQIRESFDWDYLKPEDYYALIDLVSLPTDIQRRLVFTNTVLNKKLVHKQSQENVILSEYEKYGNSIVFRGYDDWHELMSDHKSDHVDGIKLVEVVRQAMLAAFHINNLQYDSAVALASIKLDYFKYVETFTPFLVHVIPVNKADGGAMFVLFAIYQEGQLVTKGYSGAYTFRSKVAFKQKRRELIEGAYRLAEKEQWPITDSKTI